MPHPRTLVLAVLLALFASAAPALAGDPRPAAPERDVDDLEDLLPRCETLRERTAWEGREDLMPVRSGRADPPPAAPVRNVAEWEPATGVLIRYPLGLPYDLLRDLDDDVILHVVVSSSYESTAQSNLAANGVDMGKVQFLVKPNDSIWTRDYGPWYVFDGAGDLCIVDHTYNRPWRPNDNLIPVYFGQQQGLPVHSHDMYHTGGNYMTDGAHLSMSTRLVYDEAASENGMSQAEVDVLMADYYGLTTYHTLEYIESGGIHHIDTMAKFLDEDTILLKEVWSGHATYAALEQRATLLASLVASTGQLFDVRRVYCYDIGWGEPASYTNSLILNDRIYVPCFGDAAYDSAAVQAYRDAAPGYDVRGYYYSGFLTDDALHCRTKAAFDPGMIRVLHTPVEGATIGPVTVTVEVETHGADPLSEVQLVWRYDDAAWQVEPMDDMGGGIFEGTIPGDVVGHTVDYHVLARDIAGREEGSPRRAPATWHSFVLDPFTGVGESPPATGVPRLAPNPFNPATAFTFDLRDPAPVRLTVVDPRGRTVRSLLTGEIRPAGSNEIRWDGRDDAGREAPSGAYLFVLEAAGLRYTRPAALVR